MTAVHAPLFALVAFLSVAPLTGCASPMVGFYRSVSTAAVLVTNGYEALSAENTKQETAIQAQAVSDVAAARAARDAWRSKYHTIRTVIDSLAIAASLALKSAPVIENAASKSKDIADWIAKLVALGGEVIRELAANGIALPGGG